MTRRMLLISAALLAASPVAAAQAATVTCGQVITTSITVDNDLANCTGKGLVVGANDITIDLNGHTIDGGGSLGSFHRGVDVGPFDGVTVRNGRIAHFGIGVWLGTDADPATGAVIVVLRLDQNDSAIQDNPGARNIIAFNEVTGFGDGIFLASSNAGGSTVAYNVVPQGLSVSTPDNRIVHNEASSIDVDGARNHVAWNRAAGIDFSGFRFVVRGSDSTIEYNTALGGRVGIVVQGLRNVVRRNIVLRTDEIGLWVNSGYRVPTAADNVLLNNTVSQGVDGIVVSSGGCDSGGCREPALRTLVRHNRTRYNAGDGIRVEAPHTTLVRNIARHNHDLGIEAIAGVTDGGENRAAFNGNPAQCVGVVCSPCRSA